MVGTGSRSSRSSSAWPRSAKSGPPSGWANLDIYARYDHTRGERGPWCWCPAGAADVVTGGGLPGMGWHVSTFAVWQAERRQAVTPPTPPVSTTADTAVDAADAAGDTATAASPPPTP